ncbi:hypothetical protein H9P43_008103 [Blastocladiella emersonii ATCC 22665]|nr:hypothetical protein H9P43_008103 [Blastocladiella emersonii ATCC 22665]
MKHHHARGPLAALVAVTLLAVLAQAPQPAEGAALLSAAVAYIPSLKRLYFFGGSNGTVPTSTAGYLDLSQSFQVDKLPVTFLPSLPRASSQLIPVVAKGTKDGEFAIEVSTGWYRRPSDGNASYTPSPYVYRYDVPAHTVRTLDAQTNTNFRLCARSATVVPVQEWFGPATSAAETDNSMYCYGGYLPDVSNLPDTNTLRAVGTNGNLRVVTAANAGPSARYNGAMARINATTAVFSGGAVNNRSDTAVWMYNIPSSTWSAYPNPLSAGRETHQMIAYTSPKGARYLIVVGDGPPLIEYFDLSRSGPAVSASIANSAEGPRSIASQALVLAGNQLLLIGGNVNDASDQRDVHILKIVPKDSGLDFEWTVTFNPPSSADIAQAYGYGTTRSPTDPSATGAPSSGDTSTADKSDSSSFPTVPVVLGVLVAALLAAGFVFLKRTRRNGNDVPKPSHTPIPTHSTTDGNNGAASVPGTPAGAARPVSTMIPMHSTGASAVAGAYATSPPVSQVGTNVYYPNQQQQAAAMQGGGMAMPQPQPMDPNQQQQFQGQGQQQQFQQQQYYVQQQQAQAQAQQGGIIPMPMPSAPNGGAMPGSSADPRASMMMPQPQPGQYEQFHQHVQQHQVMYSGPMYAAPAAATAAAATSGMGSPPYPMHFGMPTKDDNKPLGAPLASAPLASAPPPAAPMSPTTTAAEWRQSMVVTTTPMDNAGGAPAAAAQGTGSKRTSTIIGSPVPATADEELFLPGSTAPLPNAVSGTATVAVPESEQGVPMSHYRT